MAAPNDDSLERLSRLMDLEDKITAALEADPSLSADQRKQLIAELNERYEKGELGEDDWDGGDDALGVLVRRLGPRGPVGRSGVAVNPEEELGHSL